MRPQEPPATVQQTIRHQFHQAAGETDEWAHLAAAVLAARLSYVSVVTPPQAVRPRLRSLQLVSVHDFAALLVVVLQETQVLQQTIRLERPASQDELNEIAARLNTLYGGRTADEIRASQSEHLSLDGDVLGVALDLIESAEVDAFGEASLEGLREMLREPEFAAGDSMLSLLDLLERSNLPKAIPLARVGEHEIVAVIGSEHPQDAMRQCSVVISRYAGASGLRGTISVVGPTRMHYPRAVSLVRYMSALMEELLDAYFG
jgi:heat-inducible transcriptional repressor